VQCGKTFYRRNGIRKFCQLKCYWQNKTGKPITSRRRRETRLCIGCNTVFEERPSVTRRYCSRTCYLEHWRPGIGCGFQKGNKFAYLRTPQSLAANRDRMRRRVMSDEQRRRIRLSLLGKRHSEERRRKNGIAHRGLLSGNRHPNWKGGRTKERERVRQLWPYKQWRMAVFLRDDFTCQS